MAFDQYISHPAKTDDGEPTLLIGENGQFDDDGHLQTVADRMIEACRGQTLADGTPAAVVAEVVGLTHDFAKLTSWAQQHLRNQPFQQSDEYRYHAFPSALVTLYCLTTCRDDVGTHTAEVATLVVAGHHHTTAPPDPSEMAEQYGRLTETVMGTYERVREQLNDIDHEVPARADRIIRAATSGEGSWEEFHEWHDHRTDPIDGAHDHLVYFAKRGDSPAHDGYYGDMIRLWTALKFADQTAASGLTAADLGGILPDTGALDDHVEALDDGQGVLKALNRLRNQARTTATENVDVLLESEAVGLITLPTGFGKTYVGLSAGLRAAALRDSRLVYVLPYTSILDQTAREIQSIFDVSPYSKRFTLHHHLSHTYTGLGDHHTDADIGRSPGVLHAESWLSGLTLTTTVQLFESITAPTARQATRVPSLHEAVVVIDEPQAIPESWWQLVPTLIELLVETYDATVILMTATQPGLIKYGSATLETRDLTDNTDQYTDFLATHPRVTYRLHDTVRTEFGDEATTLDYPTAGSLVAEAARHGTSALAICNTRASAEDLYRYAVPTAGRDDAPVELGCLLHDHTAETGALPTPVQLRELALDATQKQGANTVAAFLSGNVRPNDRSLLIDTLYDDEVGNTTDPAPLLDCDLSIVLIATSVVEAGVDISFETVFRDYAPIPNIVQSGGRCNRSFGGETGAVVVWQLAEPDDGTGLPSLVIHGSDGGEALPLLRETGRVLRRYATHDGSIDESTMVSNTVADFYESLFEGPLDPGDEHLAAAVESAAMSDLKGEHMIDEIEDYEDVIACLTDGERDTLLTDELTPADISRHPGVQVNTNPDVWADEITIGNSRYLLLDARNTASYHPVFGVR